MAGEEYWAIEFFKTIVSYNEFTIPAISFIGMALSAICIGSSMSYLYIENLKAKNKTPEYPPLTTKEAVKLLLKAAVILILLYVWAKLGKSTKENTDMDINKKMYKLSSVAKHYMVISISISNHELFRTLITWMFSPILSDTTYELRLKKSIGNKETYLIDKTFTTFGTMGLLCCILLGLLYNFTQNWMINNMILLGWLTTSMKYFHMNKMKTGCILLVLFLIYDVFFVFATDIMETVAKNMKIPALLLFPSNFINKGLEADMFYVLGAGDVLFPGLMMAFLLRFDLSLKRSVTGICLYYYTSVLLYSLGLAMTFVISKLTQRPQPALLYLVPCVLIPTLVLAFCRGEADKLFKFEDYPSFEEQNNETRTEDQDNDDSSPSHSSSNDPVDKTKKE